MGDLREVDRVLRQYRPLVRKLAHQLIARLPASEEMDDLVQAGMLGLHEALDSFDPGRGVLFETFASRRIHGAMLDELRSHDWLTRADRRAQRMERTARIRAEHKHGRHATDGEVAAEMGVRLEQMRGIACAKQVDEEVEQADAMTPADILQQRQRHAALYAAISCLPDRQQQLLSMQYEQDLSSREIAAVFGVSESRVCQMRAALIAKLQIQLRQW